MPAAGPYPLFGQVTTSRSTSDSAPQQSAQYFVSALRNRDQQRHASGDGVVFASPVLISVRWRGPVFRSTLSYRFALQPSVASG